MAKQGSEPKTVRLNMNIIKKVQNLAEQENRNFSNMVETLLMEATKEIRI